jgi:hypothetical protein
MTDADFDPLALSTGGVAPELCHAPMKPAYAAARKRQIDRAQVAVKKARPEIATIRATIGAREAPFETALEFLERIAPKPPAATPQAIGAPPQQLMDTLQAAVAAARDAPHHSVSAPERALMKEIAIENTKLLRRADVIAAKHMSSRVFSALLDNLQSLFSDSHSTAERAKMVANALAASARINRYLTVLAGTDAAYTQAIGAAAPQAMSDAPTP